MFAAIFPSACFQDAMCHDGTNSAGKPHTYFASDVLESENHPDAEPSHQVLFAKSLLRLEGQPLPPDQEIHNRARSKPLERSIRKPSHTSSSPRMAVGNPPSSCATTSLTTPTLLISRVIDPVIYTVIDPPWGMVI